MIATSQQRKTDTSVGIISISSQLPPDVETVREVFHSEGIDYSESVAEQLGIQQIHVYKGQNKTDLAIAAAKECLKMSGISAKDLGAIIDFSVMPEEYVVPSWSISNPIQQELGAVNAMNIGFGGNGATNLLVALHYVCALIKTCQINTALLVAADIAIKGNRVLLGSGPLTVLGDGASALIVSKETGLCEILDIELGNDCCRHDIAYIRGGGIAFPDREDLYKLQIDHQKLDLKSAWSATKQKSDIVRQREGLEYSEIAHLIFPGISANDQKLGLETFGRKEPTGFENNRRLNGHMQAIDISMGLQQLINRPKRQNREWGIACSHGWGFACGAMLVRC
jgi:3-oxoacyl-[acyl-carrier-protein] synthase III